MPEFIRTGGTTYTGNFGNKLVTMGGCSGTTNNSCAAKGLYVGGANNKAAKRIVAPKISKQTIATRGNNNNPSKSSQIAAETKLFLKNAATQNLFSSKSQTGGKRRHSCRKGKKFCKGKRSKTMKGRLDFTTKKKSKRYNEKRFKRLFGRKTMRAPIFPWAGGAAKKCKSVKKHHSRKHKKHHAKNKLHMKGGSMSPLDYSTLPKGMKTPPITDIPNSNYYSINNNPGKAGRLANPIPIVSKPSCPMK